MKSYASAVSKSCSEAFAPKRIQTVVRKIAVKEETMKNVIVYGVREKMFGVKWSTFSQILVRSLLFAIVPDWGHEKRVL